MHLEGALDALGVVGVEPRRRLRVHARELRVQRGPAPPPRRLLELGADRRIGGRQRRQPAHQRALVEHRSAHEERNAPARGDLAGHAQRVGAEASRRVRLGGLDDVDEMVRDGGPRGRVGLGRADVHAAIDERRVDAHDLHGQARREGQRHRGLAARRGPEHEDGAAAPRHRVPALAATKEETVEVRHRELHPGRAAVVAAAGALGLLHLAKQRVHLRHREACGSRARRHGTPSWTGARCAARPARGSRRIRASRRAPSAASRARRGRRAAPARRARRGRAAPPRPPRTPGSPAPRRERSASSTSSAVAGIAMGTRSGCAGSREASSAPLSRS